MKNFIYFILSVVLILATIYVLKPWYNKNKIPPVIYLNIDKKEVKLSDINLNNKQTYIFYVSPTCEYCGNINSVLDTLSVSKFNRIIVCSNVEKVNYVAYKNKFKLKKEDYFLVDSKNKFLYDFNINTNYSLPLVINFDKNGTKK